MKVIVLSLCSLLLTGCAGLSVQNMFSHYSASNASSYQHLQSGDYAAAQNAIADTGGEFLAGVEHGRIAFLAGDYDQSLAALKEADVYWTNEQRQAQIRLSEGVEQASSLLLNDNVITYIPSPYEAGFLHLYMALNYLQSRDLEGTLVEVRRANRVQEAALKIREGQRSVASQQASESGVTQNVGAVLARYPDVGDNLATTQNAYLSFFSALMYEADNDLNSAYVEIRRTLAVAPENDVVIDSAMRIATRLGMRDDLQILERRYGKYDAPDKMQSTLIVIDEQQVVNALQMWRLPLVLWDSNYRDAIYNVSLPYYPEQRFLPYQSVSVDNVPVQKSLVTDVNLMASQVLNDNMLAIITRQALRILAKDQVRQGAVSGTSDEYKELSNTVVNIFNLLTDQADTRSWQSLPGRVYLSQQTLDEGEVTVSSGESRWTVPVRPGRTTLFWVSRQSASASGWHVLLGANQ